MVMALPAWLKVILLVAAKVITPDETRAITPAVIPARLRLNQLCVCSVWGIAGATEAVIVEPLSPKVTPLLLAKLYEAPPTPPTKEAVITPLLRPKDTLFEFWKVTTPAF